MNIIADVGDPPYQIETDSLSYDDDPSSPTISRPYPPGTALYVDGGEIT